MDTMAGRGLRTLEISIKDGKPRLRKRDLLPKDVARIHLGLARIKRPLYFGLQRRNLQQTREHLFVLEEMERWLRVARRVARSMVWE